MTSVLITGAAGFIGSTLAAYFRQQGVTVFADAEPGHPGNTTTRWPISESSLLQVAAGSTPDLIIHGAGSGTVAKVASQPALELPASLGAWLAVLQYARLHAPRARVVLLSSAARYGNAPATPQREDETRSPLSLYGMTKAHAEDLAGFYAQVHGVRCTAVRLFSVYGPGLRKQLLWDAMLKFRAGRDDFFGTGREQRDWLHVDDVCSFMSALGARSVGPDFEVFNCGGQAASTSEVLTLLAAQVGARAPQFNGQKRAGDPTCLVADCSKAQRELGWRAQRAWRDGVAEYAGWFSTQVQP